MKEFGLYRGPSESDFVSQSEVRKEYALRGEEMDRRITN